MEKAEPTLVPEWLRSGSVSVGGKATHHITSSSNSDVPSSAYPSRNKSFKSIIDLDRPALERSASSDSRRSISSNGSSKHPYSSFGRSNRDKEREREKERTIDVDHRDFDPLGNMPTGRILKDTLMHSRSMGSRNGHLNGNGVHSGKTIGSSAKKVVFEKDFPSLGSDERHDIRRVPSPSLTSAIQNLPISNSALMGAEGWSALAEVPSMAPQLVSHLSAPVASCASGTMSGLNMAEALSQVPSRSRNAPQVSVETQRLEELAIRKSRQLVPMTPSLPKALMSSSDKLKPKTSVRSGEISATPKAGQQSASQTLRGGQVKSEPLKTSQAGKFHVLKPVRDKSGVSHAAKDVASPINNPSSPLAVPSVPNNPKQLTLERKTAPLPLHLGPASEKKPMSQAQSRLDFFNLMRKKSSIKSSTVVNASSDEVIKEVIGDSENPHVVENSEVASNGDSSEEAKKFSDEEETAFLRSLGWDENGGEEEGLTEEEINAFYQECLKLKPTLKMCQGMQRKLSMMSESHATNLGGADLSSSSSDSEA